MPKDLNGTTAVSLQMSEFERTLIDKAASIQGRSRNDFILAAARRAAEDAILDQRVITMGQQDYEHMLSTLDRPPESSEKLSTLMRSKAPWDQ